MNYKTGQAIKVTGIDMQCNKVIVDAIFVRYLDKVEEFECFDGSIMKQDCVVESDGCKTITDSETIL